MDTHRAMPRYRHSIGRRVVVGFAACGLSALAYIPASAAAQTPPVTGCPAGFNTLLVADLIPMGYHVPLLIDDPANGGNGDGVVCGKPINPTRAAEICGGPCGVPVLYGFRENTLTPWH